MTSAIVISYNSGLDLCDCVESLSSHPELTEIVVVDNASEDGSFEDACARFSAIVPVRNATNEGYAAAANRGAGIATGDVVLFLNPDVRLEPGCVGELERCLAEHPGVAGPVELLEATDETHYGSTLNHLGFPKALAEGEPPLWVPGFALATSRELFRRLGGFDDRYFMFIEDIDYCWRVLLAGGDVRVPAAARALHRGGGSTPGGYAKARGMETTALRLVSRHRYTLATILKCVPARWLPVVVPAYVGKTILTAAVALVLAKPGMSWGLLATIGWNARCLRETLALRRGTPRTRESERRAWRRLGWGFYELAFLLRTGPPRLR